eukprot:148715_1
MANHTHCQSHHDRSFPNLSHESITSYALLHVVPNQMAGTTSYALLPAVPSVPNQMAGITSYASLPAVPNQEDYANLECIKLQWNRSKSYLNDTNNPRIVQTSGRLREPKGNTVPQ